MVLDKALSRRQLLRIGAGGAVAVGLAPLGPSAVLAAPPDPTGYRSAHPSRQGGHDHVHPTGRAGPVGIAASAALGVSPTMGFLGGAQLPAKTPRISVRWYRCRVGGESCWNTWQTSATTRSSSPATGRTPTTPAGRPPTRLPAV